MAFQKFAKNGLIHFWSKSKAIALEKLAYKISSIFAEKEGYRIAIIVKLLNSFLVKLLCDIFFTFAKMIRVLLIFSMIFRKQTIIL